MISRIDLVIKFGRPPILCRISPDRFNPQFFLSFTRTWGLVLCSLWFFSSCHSDRPVDQLTEQFGKQYRESFAADLPEVASLADLSRRLDSLARYRQLMTAIDTHSLSVEGKIQKQILQRQLEAEWANWLPYQHNPALYNLGGLLKQQLVQTDQDARTRWQRVSDLMDQADAYYAQARRNLRVTDMSLYRLASQKQYLGLAFLQGELQDSLAAADLPPEEKRLMLRKMETTYRALKDYLAFCESAYLNHQDLTHYTVGE